MSKPQRRPALPPALMQNLPERATEALAQGRFKEAIDLFKQLIRQEPRADWKAALNDAYCGRARALAAKQMFKEAAMVLENTRAPDGALRDPLLYATCLIRDGQQPKAAAHLLQAVCSAALPAPDRPRAEAVLAALLSVVALPPAAIADEPPERLRWREAAAAARAALTAWTEGAAAAEMDTALSRISLRSAFRPLRLLLKALVAAPDATGKSLLLLETIETDSPFFPLREAIDSAAGAGFSAEIWNRLSRAQRSFVAETAGIPAPTVDAIEALSQAAASGPSAVFATLLKRAAGTRHGLDPDDLRSACLNLLPKLPDRIGQFEKQFGRLPPLDRARIEALAAEAAENWVAAETYWRRAAHAIDELEPAASAGLARAVIFRHLADLAASHHSIQGAETEPDAVFYYLSRADEADPEHVPTLLARMARLRESSRDKEWHHLADEAAQRFPQNRQVLLQATESAVARQAYKKAAGYARRLLAIDPINPGVRRQMVELQVAYARKQLRDNRPDLAARGLDEAAQWERADSPLAVLRMYRGLVALQEGKRDVGQSLIRQGVDLAGGGVAGWFRVVLETVLTKTAAGNAAWMREELSQARKASPAKEAVQAVVQALGAPEAVAAKRALASLLAGMQSWLVSASGLAWSHAEFQALEDTLVCYEQFTVLSAFAHAGRRREPGNRIWRFHEILARTCNDHRRMMVREEDELEEIGRAAAERKDARTIARLRRYLQITDAGPHAMDSDFEDMDEVLEAADFLNMLQNAQNPLPKDLEREVRAQVARSGRAAAIAELAEVLAEGPDGLPIPKTLSRKLAEAMVMAAMDRPARPARGGRF